MEIRAVYEGELEVRQAGRRLAGRFPYSKGTGDRMATVMDRGKVRKERDRRVMLSDGKSGNSKSCKVNWPQVIDVRRG